MKPPRIIELDNIGGGGYLPKHHVIFIDKKLRNYPNLRKEIINHELEHSKHGYNVWEHIKIDRKYMEILKQPEAIEYRLKYCYDLESELKELYVSLTYGIVNFFVTWLDSMKYVIIDLKYMLNRILKKKLGSSVVRQTRWPHEPESGGSNPPSSK